LEERKSRPAPGSLQNGAGRTKADMAVSLSLGGYNISH
jgi:hypothetical protein